MEVAFQARKILVVNSFRTNWEYNYLKKKDITEKPIIRDPMGNMGRRNKGGII